MRAIRIVSLPVDRGGCGWYRIRQPFENIQLHTESDTYLVDNAEDPVKHVKAFQYAHVVVVRQGGEAAIPNLKSVPEFKHLKFVLDIDDNVELISPYSEHYKEYGTKEFYDNNQKKLIWKDGEGDFDLQRNRTKVMNLMMGLRQADLVTTTTQRLADYAKGYNKNVVVLPNCIDFEHWWKPAMQKGEQLRIGWSGGMSHYEDWYTIKKPLNKLLRKYKFKLVVVGSHFTGIVDEDLRHLVEIYPWVAFEAHSYRMMLMNLDIAIIPLADLPFNYFKSSIKFYEMSAMGVPSLIADVPPYKDDNNGKNALFYKDEQDFEDKLEALIQSETLRKEVAVNGFEYTYDNFNAKTNAHLWTDAYEKLLPEEIIDNKVVSTP